MRRGPEFRIVGGAPEEEKGKARKRLEDLLGEKHLELLKLTKESKEELRRLEYPKSPIELALIDVANQETSELMEKAGLDPYDIPERNIHIVPPEIYKRASEEHGSALSIARDQVILMDARECRASLLAFARYTFHELMHLKGHFTLEVQEIVEREKPDVKETAYQSGLTVYSPQKKRLHGEYHEHFRGAEEAIVALQEKKFLSELLKHPLFKEEKEWLDSSEALEFKQKIAKDEELPIEDIFWVSKDGQEYEAIDYWRQRKVLNYVMEQIRVAYPDEVYKSTEDVLSEFRNSIFTGRLRPIKKIVEHTFGKGSFRVLGMMKDDKESPVEVLEALRKMRLSHLKLTKGEKPTNS